jgi:hypothetical protein
MYKILDALSKWMKCHPEIGVERVYVEYAPGFLKFGIVFRSGHYIEGFIDLKMIDDDNVYETIINEFNEEYESLK